MNRETLRKIAYHHGELSKYFAMLANEPNGHKPPLIPTSEAVKCDCGKLAKTQTGVAKTGPKQGQKFIKYICPDNRCDFKKFEDA